MQNLFGRPLSCCGGAVEVSVPLGGSLGTGPRDPAEWLADRTAVGRPAAGRQVGIVGAASELVLRPESLDIIRRISDVFPEDLGEVVNERVLAAIRREPDPLKELLALNEAGQDAWSLIAR